MRLCMTNRIQLVYLPPHTSHVLQPLDISVFGPLKAAYRAALTLANPLVDTSPTRKETFLRCYFEARDIALIESNIKSGWLGSGLWPMNINKLMGSKFVIDDQGQSIVVQLDNTQLPEMDTATNEIEFTTPNHSSDLQRLVRSQFKVSRNSPTTRRLFRTAGKSIDKWGWENAQLRAENESLKQELGQLKKRKRAAVERDPNKLFVSIANIRATRRQVEPIESSGSE